jgi:hypothetical protein
MATIGYLEGLDPLLLTRLAVKGVGTLPLSNGFDNHGKFISNVTEREGVDVIVGYLHKVLRTQRQGFFAEDMLQSCRDCQIPVWILVPEADQAAARQVLGSVSEWILLVDPDRLYDLLVEFFGLS